MSGPQLASHYNTSGPTIRKWLTEHGIPKRSHKEACDIATANRAVPIPDREEFYEKYTTQSMQELYDYYKIGQETLYTWLDILEIPRMTLGERCVIARGKQYASIQFTKEEILEEYKVLKNMQLVAEKLGASHSHIRKLCRDYGIEADISFRSVAEEKLFDHCGEDFISNTKKIIAPFELDLYSEERKFAIEYCGIYWHSEFLGKKDKKYHANKLQICEELGIDLLTIFESDDFEKVKNLIDSKLGRIPTIGARKTKLKEISPKEARIFHDKYHLSGFSGARVHLGLYHDENLVQVASFGKSRFNKNFEWECIRMTVHPELKVIGGASKLFSNFLKNNTGGLITYADLRFGNGKVYEYCGLKYKGKTEPNYWYFHKKDMTKLYSRVAFQKHKLEDKLEKFDPNKTEYENMLINGWDRIWDCGNAIYTT